MTRSDQSDPVGEVRGVVEALGLEWAQAENITKQDFDVFRKYEGAVGTIELNVAILERMLDGLLPEREGETPADRAAKRGKASEVLEGMSQPVQAALARKIEAELTRRGSRP